MNDFKPICEVAKDFNVSRMGVRYWIDRHNIEYEYRKELGRKARIFLNVRQLEEALNFKKEV